MLPIKKIKKNSMPSSLAQNIRAERKRRQKRTQRTEAFLMLVFRSNSYKTLGIWFRSATDPDYPEQSLDFFYQSTNRKGNKVFAPSFFCVCVCGFRFFDPVSQSCNYKDVLRFTQLFAYRWVSSIKSDSGSNRHPGGWRAGPSKGLSLGKVRNMTPHDNVFKKTNNRI